jgi:hypothetical protein
MLPHGWHRVRLRNLPDADVPLELASSHLHGDASTRF